MITVKDIKEQEKIETARQLTEEIVKELYKIDYDLKDINNKSVIFNAIKNKLDEGIDFSI